MQDFLVFAGTALVGISAGVIGALFFSRARVAVLLQKLEAAGEAIRTAERETAEQKVEACRVREALQEQAELRAAAEERAKRVPDLATQVNALLQGNADLLAEKSKLITLVESERKNSAEKLAQIEDLKQKLTESFKALSSEALQSNNKMFLDLAKSTLEKAQESAKGDLEKKEQAIAAIVKPVRETLDKFDSKIQDIEKARVGAYSQLLEQLGDLRSQTGSLAQALRTPSVRGRWGELQLKRVFELAGMIEHCDFELQTSVDTEEGRRRPDAVVKLPGGRQIVVDAKVPLEAFLAALEAKDETERQSRMEDHARQIRNHIAQLARKSYWEHFEHTPEFVVLFLPGESLFSAALQVDSTLLETTEKVVLATPTTLIAVLRAVAQGWREAKLAEHAQEISDLGRELHKRISDLAEHWSKMGRNLALAVESYNKAVASMESRVLPSARKFKELQAGSEREIEFLPAIEQAPRFLQAPEFAEQELFVKEAN